MEEIKFINKPLNNEEVNDWAKYMRPPTIEEEKKSKEQLYFIISDLGYIKIGHTRQGVEKRLKELQTGHPVKLKVYYSHKDFYAKEEEKKLHEKFSHIKTHGEWFIFNDEIKNYIYDNLLGIVITSKPNKKVYEVNLPPREKGFKRSKEEKIKIRKKVLRAKKSKTPENKAKHKAQLEVNSKKMQEIFDKYLSHNNEVISEGRVTRASQ